MATTTVPTTELNAVNTMLATIGEAPISTLDGTLTTDVTMAKNILDEVSRVVQAMGWHFNTVFDHTFSKDESDEIPLAADVIKADVSPNVYNKSDTDPVIRYDSGTPKFYNRYKGTFSWDKDLKGSYTILMDFEDLPQVGRDYIMYRSSRIFQERMVGAEVLNKNLSINEAQALSLLREAENNSADYTIFDSPSTLSIIDR